MQLIILILAPLSLGLLSDGLRAQAAAVPAGNVGGQHPQAAAIAAALKAHLAEASSFKDAEIEIRLLTDLGNVDLPAGEVSYRVVQSFAPSNYRNLQVPVEASVEGKLSRTFFVAAELTIRAEVVQTARRIAYGTILSPDDLKLGMTEILRPRLSYLRSCSEVLGMTARHALGAGVPLSREDLAKPVLVRSGEIVHLRLERNGIRLAMLGRAEQNGQLGQLIRVKNLDFSQTITVRVIGRGETVVE